MKRYGITIPLEGVPLHEHREWLSEIVDLGYTDLWTSESNGADAFTPLALAAAWAPSVRLGTAIAGVFVRGPALLAMTAAAMAEAAPGRFVLGVGTSSSVIVENWNDVPFERPYYRARDSLRFLRQALGNEKVEGEFDTFNIRGFRLGRLLDDPPPILLAALRRGMLQLAGREADGAIINWLSAEDVKEVVRHVHEGGPNKEIVARILVCATEDRAAALDFGRRACAAYLNVPVYAAFHDWLGRGPRLAPLWQAWKEGNRKGALATIPDDLVDELVVSGTPEQCREHIQRYVDSGVTTPVLAIAPVGDDLRQVIRHLAPAAY